MKNLSGISAISILLVASLAHAGVDVTYRVPRLALNTSTTAQRDCERAGGTWDATTKTCSYSPPGAGDANWAWDGVVPFASSARDALRVEKLYAVTLDKNGLITSRLELKKDASYPAPSNFTATVLLIVTPSVWSNAVVGKKLSGAEAFARFYPTDPTQKVPNDPQLLADLRTSLLAASGAKDVVVTVVNNKLVIKAP